METQAETEISEPLKQQVEEFKTSFERRMALSIVHDLDNSSKRDQFCALAYAVRDKIIHKWLKTQKQYYRDNPKRVYYLSLEYLMGRALDNAVINLNFKEVVVETLKELNLSFEELEEQEWDAGLGNGGLGRLAACFLDSMATLELPAYGYGIRYEFGMFKQSIIKLQQKESPDNWLRFGNPWEIARPENLYKVHFGGKVKNFEDRDGNWNARWVETDTVMAMSYDVPIPGYKTETVNSLKLWAAKSTRDFNLETFNAGDYIGAIIEKHLSECISKVLYPNDNNYKGKELRLKQQYFVVSASLQDILNRTEEKCGDDIRDLHEKVAIQLNDTHPSIAIPELMRILVDERGVFWDEAWYITTHTFAYTNHTVLPEALEKWPVSLLSKVLPRHMQIIYEINQRFLDEVAAMFPGDFDRRTRMSIIEGEDDKKQIRMAHLAIVGAFSVNGVAELHTKLLKEGIFRDFYELWPEKFNNKTNGVTPRRWVQKANPQLSALLTRKIGDGWVKHLDQLRQIEAYADEPQFVHDWQEIKRNNKLNLAKIIKEECYLDVNVDSIFDVQVKRFHEYKRQLLNLLHVITLFNRIERGDVNNMAPRTIIFSGKAAPGYMRAKEVIHLINSVASVVNKNRRVRDLLKVVFIPNYGVSLAEHIFPGSDLSEQISTAGMEASGTGNMKFALNGALTIGTLDGANIEIKEEVGDENIFIFGHTEEELKNLRNSGYNPEHYYHNDYELRQVLDQIRNGYFSPNQPSLFEEIFNSLVHQGDHFFVLADYRKYIECQERVSQVYQDQKLWTKMAILNVARMGKFSSDRVIQQYADEIWKVKPLKIE